ncbi:hypothetical protein COOONC_22965 [Cooperia oncophora]
MWVTRLNLHFHVYRLYKKSFARICCKRSLDYVIRRCLKAFSTKDSRLHFITKNELLNTIAEHGLRPGFRDENDLNSLQLRAAEQNLDDGTRLLQTPADRSGKGFIVGGIMLAYSTRGISVDDTHGATRYNLKLATIVIADERDRGLPAATMTSLDVEKLFEE